MFLLGFLPRDTAKHHRENIIDILKRYAISEALLLILCLTSSPDRTIRNWSDFSKSEGLQNVGSVLVCRFTRALQRTKQYTTANQ